MITPANSCALCGGEHDPRETQIASVVKGWSHMACYNHLAQSNPGQDPAKLLNDLLICCPAKAQLDVYQKLIDTFSQKLIGHVDEIPVGQMVLTQGDKNHYFKINREPDEWGQITPLQLIRSVDRRQTRKVDAKPKVDSASLGDGAVEVAGEGRVVAVEKTGGDEAGQSKVPALAAVGPVVTSADPVAQARATIPGACGECGQMMGSTACLEAHP